jgi:prevent-host-death family protein
MMDLVEDVVLISDLRTKAAQIIERIHQTGRPILVTQHGRSTAVLLDVAEYQRQQRRMALLEQIALSKRDVAAGRVYTQEQIEAELEDWLQQNE